MKNNLSLEYFGGKNNEGKGPLCYLYAEGCRGIA